MYVTVGATHVAHAGAATTGAAHDWQPNQPALLMAGIASTTTATLHTTVKNRIFEFTITSPPEQRREFFTFFIKPRTSVHVKRRPSDE
jgi:hypothetical protein